MIFPVFLAVVPHRCVVTDKLEKISIIFFIGFNIVFTAFLIFADTWWKLSIIYGIIGFLMEVIQQRLVHFLWIVTNPRIVRRNMVFNRIANVGLNGGGMITGSLVVTLALRVLFSMLLGFWSSITRLYFIKLKKTM